MRKSTNLENPINQYSTLNQLLQPHLGVLPNAFGIAFKPTAAINVHGAFPQKSIGGAVGATLGNAPYSDSVLLRSAFGIALCKMG
ncbi:MAG: hypothetical protein ACKO8H_00835 [Microcystis panniformis]